MTMVVNLKTYLETIRQHERSKPEGERLHVPTLRELAEKIPMNDKAFGRIANSKVKGLTLEVGDKIIATMRSYGHPMQVSDLLVYYDDVSRAKN